jgi:LAO/AO transport system kinase
MDLQPLSYYLDGISQGDRRILAQSITLVESRRGDHRRMAGEMIDALLPRTGKSVRLGITGVPGAGKSTLIENFGMLLIEKGHKVAVLTIDPSSRRSGGSILADKTRMERLSQQESAFIRPTPSGGTLGGVARMTRETMLVCEAAGFDVVIVETVGVGQSETTVASMVDFFLVVMITGAGDSLQGIKKGILELAHAVAINKADGKNLVAAEKARTELENAIHLMLPAQDGWQTPVVTCSALTLAGLEAIWEKVRDHRRFLEEGGALDRRRSEQALAWMWALIEEGLSERFRSHPEIKTRIPQMAEQVRRGCISAPQAARQLLLLLDNNNEDDTNFSSFGIDKQPN